MLQLHGLLLSPPDQLPPSGNFTTLTQLVTVFDETAGEVFKLTAHVARRFDHHRLSELAAEPQLFDEFVAEMAARGVGLASQRKPR